MARQRAEVLPSKDAHDGLPFVAQAHLRTQPPPARTHNSNRATVENTPNPEDTTA